MESNINLIPYRDVTLIFGGRRVIGVHTSSPNFITDASFSMKSDAICKLKEAEYITEDLAEYLLHKLYEPVSALSDMTPSNIHLRKYSDKIFIFKRKTIIAIFQYGKIDFIYNAPKDVQDKVVEQLKKFKYMH